MNAHVKPAAHDGAGIMGVVADWRVKRDMAHTAVGSVEAARKVRLWVLALLEAMRERCRCRLGSLWGSLCVWPLVGA